MPKGFEYRSKEEMEYNFRWVRKHFYTDLIKLFLVKDIDDYNDYKYSLFGCFHSLDVLKKDKDVSTGEYIKNTLLNLGDLQGEIDIAVDWYNKRNQTLFKWSEPYVKIGRFYYEKEDVIYPSDITIDFIDIDEFTKFATLYIDWLIGELIQNDDASFYRVSKKIDELLGWDVKFEYDRKKALKEAEENRFNQAIDIELLYNDCEKTLGIHFIELFHKIYIKEEGINIEETINEMQYLFDYIKRIGHTNNKEPLLNVEINDAFLTAWSSPEDYVEMDREEIMKYDKFCTYLLCYESVSKAFELIK